MPSRARAFGLALVLCVSSCHLVLGIEDAEVDPSLGSANKSASGGNGSPADAGSAPLASTTCELYCQTVTQTCTGEFAQYTTYDTCLNVCELLPEGTEGDREGNTVFCRLQAAGQAPLEPSYYCPLAGPGGNDVCGTNCEALCTLVGSLCDDDDDEPEDCLMSCAALEDRKTYTVSPDAELYKGKHVQCRLYHASVATLSDTEQHCQHALGNSPCK